MSEGGGVRGFASECVYLCVCQREGDEAERDRVCVQLHVWACCAHSTLKALPTRTGLLQAQTAFRDSCSSTMRTTGRSHMTLV